MHILTSLSFLNDENLPFDLIMFQKILFRNNLIFATNTERAILEATRGQSRLKFFFDGLQLTVQLDRGKCFLR